MDFLSLIELVSTPSLIAFFVMIAVNVAVMRATLTSVKSEVEKLEKKLEQLYTQLLKVSVLEARIGHIEKDLSKSQSRVDVIEQRFLFRTSFDE